MPRFKHGHAVRGARTPEYDAWSAIISRCENPANAKFADYGGRGIRMCSPWRESFPTFLRDVGPRPSGRHSIDRIDNDGDYKPDNVQWATRAEQLRNQRRSRRISFRGETLCLSEWAARQGIAWETLAGRLAAGWSAERALTEPATARAGEKNPARKLTLEQVGTIRARRADGARYSDLAAEFGVSDVTIRNICLGRTWKSFPGRAA
jgi:hypothetical protein